MRVQTRSERASGKAFQNTLEIRTLESLFLRVSDTTLSQKKPTRISSVALARLRGSIVREGRLVLLPDETIYSQLRGVWNLSSDQGNLGCFFASFRRRRNTFSSSGFFSQSVCMTPCQILKSQRRAPTRPRARDLRGISANTNRSSSRNPRELGLEAERERERESTGTRLSQNAFSTRGRAGDQRAFGVARQLGAELQRVDSVHSDAGRAHSHK